MKNHLEQNEINYVYTDTDKCLGCNKCIFVCPTNANMAFFEAEQSKVSIKHGFCISCGECLSICDHNARDYIDDTDDFFNAIKNGQTINAIIAPAARFNFLDVQRLIGYLKNIGVKNIYDVSFGADICTWAHIKSIREKGVKNIISQPCPVVVSLIEKYYPQLIGNLSPIHSPAACAATYLKNYKEKKGKIAFISPCIGKKRENVSIFNGDVINYNVTFEKLSQHMLSNNIDLQNYKQMPFDNMPGSLGFIFSRPGGLNENIKYHLGEDIWIKQIEGTKNIKHYLNQYIEDIKTGQEIPFIVDALNCENGCNLGTGTCKSTNVNRVDSEMNKAKKQLVKDNCEQLMRHFDETLNLNDFIRTYSDKSSDYKLDENIDIEKAYLSLGKVTKEDRNINCFCCGYGSCEDFVYNLAIGNNDKNNCRHYLLNKFRQLSIIDELTGIFNRYSFAADIDKIKQSNKEFVGIAYCDINGLKQANDEKGHAFGDEIIISCANLLQEEFKNSVYRIGGDEFVVICQNKTVKEFEESINKIKANIDKHEHLKASVGTANRFSDDDLDEMLNIADARMYEAKQEYYNLMGEANRRKQTNGAK